MHVQEVAQEHASRARSESARFLQFTLPYRRASARRVSLPARTFETQEVENLAARSY